MSERRIAVVTLAIIATAITGCAHKPVAPPETASQTTAVPALNTTSPAGIVALDKRLTAHHRTLFSVTKDKYSYFVGGVLLAEFEGATRILRKVWHELFHPWNKDFADIILGTRKNEHGVRILPAGHPLHRPKDSSRQRRFHGRL